VGYNFETGVRLVRVALRPETLKRVVALRATAAFSCYRPNRGLRAIPV
jgi:hypothetical protein